MPDPDNPQQVQIQDALSVRYVEYDLYPPDHWDAALVTLLLVVFQDPLKYDQKYDIGDELQKNFFCYEVYIGQSGISETHRLKRVIKLITGIMSLS